MARSPLKITQGAIRVFFASEVAGGIVLMVASAVALILANSAMAEDYENLVHLEIGGVSLLHAVNDGLMALFFLFVGLEIKQELAEGELATWGQRSLPGIAALGGMVVPAIIFVAFNSGSPGTIRGWAVPAATDIAFSLAVLSLLGKRVPTSLKVFLTALAILDDLGAVLIIAVFYTGDLSLLMLCLAAVTFVGLVGLNLLGIRILLPYLILGAALWYFVLNSGVHATIAGVLLAVTIPLRGAGTGKSPLDRLEGALSPWITFAILPVFGFVNAGVTLVGADPAIFSSPIAFGVAIGLFAGKQAGIFGALVLAVRLGVARLPAGATLLQAYGVAVLCGIGFTMSLFIGLLAFGGSPTLIDETKLGVLVGSVVSAVFGYAILAVASRKKRPAPRGVDR